MQIEVEKPFKNSPLENLSKHIVSLNKRITQLEAEHQVHTEKLVSLAVASRERFERMQKLINNIEMSFDHLNKDLKHEFAKLNSHFTQSKLQEKQTKALMDNTNQYLQNVEKQFSELVKMQNQQNMQLLQLKTILGV